MERHPFPRDLLQAQTAFYVTYVQLAARPSSEATAGRQRLLQLSQLIDAHPYWRTPAGTPAARVALREAARAGAQS
ncbi:hypothetical protein [Streptomyces sp. NPDC050738]|uniref:hypothetical protein n=1 Tax=Streptomyces sp. NPDC050738 TaxID=3154744 RepID=UPI00341D3EC8